ncbi:MAG: hypothetical protein JW891_16865 [Candidatus Lokiarchaeota archaeon]|nr:hypothetical protein [Candidatus Lokiarchaeota archaeon]
MGQRVYVKGKKTHAKDENFTQDNVGKEKERYQISIDLMSLKTLKDYDSFGRVGEFYFRADGEKMLKSRFPHKGVIKLQRNQTFTSKADMNIWSQFKTVRTGQEASVPIKVILREKDHLKKDQTIAEQVIEVKLPQVTAYVILQDADENTKAKLRIQATRTRY